MSSSRVAAAFVYGRFAPAPAPWGTVRAIFGSKQSAFTVCRCRSEPKAEHAELPENRPVFRDSLSKWKDSQLLCLWTLLNPMDRNLSSSPEPHRCVGPMTSWGHDTSPVIQRERFDERHGSLSVVDMTESRNHGYPGPTNQPLLLTLN